MNFYAFYQGVNCFCMHAWNYARARNAFSTSSCRMRYFMFNLGFHKIFCLKMSEKAYRSSYILAFFVHSLACIDRHLTQLVRTHFVCHRYWFTNSSTLCKQLLNRTANKDIIVYQKFCMHGLFISWHFQHDFFFTWNRLHVLLIKAVLSCFP